MAAEAAVARRRGLRDRGRPGRARADLRGQADRGDVASAAPDADGRLAPAAAERDRSRPPSAPRRWSSGPGSGAATAPPTLVGELARRIEAPLLIDADGLNALAGSLELARRAPRADGADPARRRARPAARDSTRDEVGAHRLANATEAAARSGAIVVLKGDDTIVADAGARRRSSTALASPALATAGTGDVLSGMIGALLARGLDARSRPLRRGPRPHARRAGRGRARRRDGVGDRHAT